MYEKAIDHYLMVLESVHHLNDKERANIYSSIAATYVDMKEYDKGLYYYQRELEEVNGDYEQMSKTHRNIADIEEKKGSKYSVLFKYFMASYEAARGAKNKKLAMEPLLVFSPPDVGT